MWYTDRSRYETGFACPRKRFWNYHFDGLGISPVGEGEDLWYGKAVHRAIELPNLRSDIPLEQIDFEGIAPDGNTKHSEWASMYEGHVKVFREFVLPQIERDFRWVASEQEISMLLTPEITWMSRLDGVLERKADGLWFVLEAKTSGWVEALVSAAPRNFQLLMELEAMRQHYKLASEKVGGAMLLTFDKGMKKKVSEAEQRRGLEGFRRLSPFTYWFKRDLASGETEYRLDWAKGWDRVPTSSVPGWWDLGLAEPEFREKFESQVKLHQGISFDPVQAETVKKQVITIERRLMTAARLAIDVDLDFPQNFSNCNHDGAFRKECPFAAACFSPQVGRDPLGSDLYEERVLNHPQEGQE